VSYFVFDIETAPDLDLQEEEEKEEPEEAPPPKKRKAKGGEVVGELEPVVKAAKKKFPPPSFHEVVSIAGAFLDADRKLIRLGVFGLDKDGNGKGEQSMLSDFVRFYEKERPTLISWNGRKFDLPIIGLRCFRHGISWPSYYGGTKGKDPRYRYMHEGHLDVMDYLADYGSGTMSKQDHVSRLVGMPGKIDGIDGGDVEGLVRSGQIDKVRTYNLQDVVQLSALFFRTELLRGRIDRMEYQTILRALFDKAAVDPRTKPVVEGTNIERLFLTESAASAATLRALILKEAPPPEPQLSLGIEGAEGAWSAAVARLADEVVDASLLPRYRVL